VQMTLRPTRRSRPTLQDVAARAGVSRATASLVVRKSPLVSAPTRQAVEAAMAEIGYVYNVGAAGMRAARSRTVGVIIPNLSNPFFGVLLAGIDQVIDAAGLATFIAHSDELPAKQDGFVARMREHGVDGLIICPAAGTQSRTIADLASWNMAVVQSLREVDGVATDYAGIDHQVGMNQAVDRLVQLGHRRIGFVGGDLVHSAQSGREAAFCAALARHDLRMHQKTELPSTFAAAAEFAKTKIGKSDAPSAWICHNDVLALGMHRGFSDAGLLPGRDVSIIGFDNVAETELVAPGLASVATEAFALGVLSAQLLLARLTSEGAPVSRRLTPSHFVERGSVGPAAAAFIRSA
jgi:LacI family transcriptional regulator